MTSIEFKDTGIKVTVEPTIHLNNAITLRLQIEVTRLGAPVILQDKPLITQFRFGTRTADTALNMRDGETVVLGGLISEEDSKSRESVPGIDDIPGLGDLLSNSKIDKVTTEVILVITPHIVRSVTPPQLAKHTMWSGTANQYNSKPMFSFTQPVSTALYQEETGEKIASLPETSENAQNTQTAQESQVPGKSKPKQKDPDPPGQSAPGTTTQIQILPGVASSKIGEEISVTVQGENFASTGNSSLTLSYDPAVVTFKNVVEGPFWSNQQVPSSLTVSVVPNIGKIVLQMGQQGKSVQGNGSLATVVFEAAGVGNSNIDIQQSTVLGANGQPIPVMVQHGRILVE